MTSETPAVRALATRRSGYWAAIWRSARSILEGMSITFSYLWKRPITLQYPDVARPLNQTLPERYRGFLEVDLATCTGCKACERDCPINCIVIDLVKVGDVRAMTRFDIDMGKCMYCNICVESCPVPNRAPGDAEETKCIRMTREFEGATDSFPDLTFRFVRPGDAAIPYKHKRGEVPATPERGLIARQVRQRASEFNRLAARWALAARADAITGAEAAFDAPQVIQARVAQLFPQVQAAGDDPRKLEDLIYAEALAQTDCESCGYPSCRDYARGLIAGDPETGKCEPGGGRSKRDVDLIFQIRRGNWASDGARQAGRQEEGAQK
jgi:formate hydrogenlyase subunit 6/NADH:ubiquinone oxidoreductase subunit I